MRDAMGGATTLVIIVVFIVIALGYMAFNVNYTKAFRMKDKILTIYEKYSGYCDSDCQKEISDYAKQIAYNAGTNLVCPGSEYEHINGLYCAKKINLNTPSDVNQKFYYNIVTKINIEIPIINNILNLKFFYINGDTKTFKTK